MYVKNENQLVSPSYIYKGIQRGAVLSPILYALYTKVLEEGIGNEIKFIQQADDICIFTSSKSAAYNANLINHELKEIQEKLNNLNLEISESKSELMIFTRKYTFDNSPPIILNNKSLNFTDKTKFLGLYLDPKLKWIHHINYIRTKCEKGINILKMTNRTWWEDTPLSA